MQPVRFPAPEERSLRGPEDRTILEGIVHYTAIMARHKRVIIITTLLGAAFAVGFAMLSKSLPPDKSPMPNVYTTSAELFVQGNQDAIAGLITTLGTPAPQLQNSRAPSYGEIAIEVLESEPFLDSIVSQYHIVSHYHITKHPRVNGSKAVLKHSKFKYDPTTQTLTITYTDTDPQFAAQMANGIVDELRAWFSQRVLSGKMRDEKFVEQKLTQVKKQLAELHAKMQQFQARYGVLSVNDLSTMRTNILSNLQSQLVLTETEISTRSGLTKVQDPMLAQLKSQRDTLLGMIRQIEQGSGAFAGTIPPTNELPKLAQQVAELNTQITIQQKIYQALSEQAGLLNLDLAAQPVFQVLQPADVPTVKSGPHRSMLVVGITFLGFFIGVVASMIASVLPKARRIYEREK